jgi:hypothetical protein
VLDTGLPSTGGFKMFKSRLKWWIFPVVLMLVAIPAQPVLADPDSQTVPPGFVLVEFDVGIELYRKDYPGWNPDFVQVVNLGLGAQIELFHGIVADPGTGSGAYGGDNPSFQRQSLREIWDEFSAENDRSFCVTNGQFFVNEINGQVINPTTLAFPLKTDGQYVSDGYGIGEYPDQKLMLELWEDRADIVPLTEKDLNASTAPDIIAGLTGDADKGPMALTGRTLIGIDDRDRDGRYEIVLIFNSKTATQTNAVQVLQDFGADKIIMLDGGGSTQLICKGTDRVSSSRTIPQSIGVVSRTAPVLYATVARQPNWSILMEDETTQIDVEIMNSGLEPWFPGNVQFTNQKNPWGASGNLQLLQEVPPGETAAFSWKTDRFSRWGVFTTEWVMTKDGVPFDETVKINVIVLPKQLEEQRRELEQQIQQWSQEQLDNIEDLVTQWIKDQVNDSLFNCYNPAFIMLPLAVLVIVNKRSR